MIIVTTRFRDDGTLVDCKTEHVNEEPECKLNKFTHIYGEEYTWHLSDADLIRHWLMSVERYANELLKAKGRLSLNDVYDLLYIPRIAAGEFVGWIYDDSSYSIDFGLRDPINVGAMNGDGYFTLTFNVQGLIIDKV